MAYVATNPPKLIVAPIGDAPAVYGYKSADDDATVNGAGYFTNALELGMRIGDLVIVADTATPKTSVHGVLSFSGSAATLGFAAVA